MKLEGAVIKEQGVTFAVVAVKQHVLRDRTEAARSITLFQPLFPGLPIVLMAQDHRGTPTYFGRRDIARFLSNVPISRIPWRQYHFN